MKRKRWFLATVLVSALAVGCRVEDYNIVIKNVGQRRIENAHVVYGQFSSVGGVLSPGIYVGHGHPDFPVPAIAMVEWRTEDGLMHRKDVEVKKLVPKGFHGDIQFEIADDNTVTVRVVPQKDP